MKITVVSFILKARPKKFGNNNGNGKSKTVATVLQDLGSDSGDETKITAMGCTKVMVLLQVLALLSNDNVNVTQQEKRRIELVSYKGCFKTY